MCVSIKGHRSKWFLVGQGVHHEGPLSSLLFQIMFDDLLKDIQNSNNGVKVYDTEITSPSFADDMNLISLSRKGLQNMLTIAYKYSRKWKFRFNPPKCMVLTFGNTSEKESIKLGDVILKEVTKCTNIGTPMYIKSSHEMEKLEVRIEKAYKKVWILKSIGSRRIQINSMAFTKGYWAAIVSKVCYGLFLTSITNKTLDRV